MPNTTELVRRNNVTFSSSGSRTIMFAHGFGCDQAMWRFVAPDFEADHRVVLFDHVGSGGSDLGAYLPSKYRHLSGYADDVVELCEGLDLRDVVFVGHSVSAMIGALAAIKAPHLFGALIMVGPSPCYLNKDGYRGGFEEQDVAEMLDILDSNYLGWSAAMAPTIMGNAERPELSGELEASFCRNDPAIARHFARVTFTSDNREDLSRVSTPTLVLQCSEDSIAPEAVGQYVHREIAGSDYVLLDATGHCPNLSAPAETSRAIRAFLDKQP